MANRDRPNVCTTVVARTLVPLALAAISVQACAGETPYPTSTGINPAEHVRRASAEAGDALVVSTPAELVAALTPTNAGRHIVVRAGVYAVSQPLTVPDGALLEGEGVMQFDGQGLPMGFDASTRTRITMTANVGGDVFTLGNGSRIRRLSVTDLPGRPGNVIGIVSRSEADEVSATVSEMELTTATGHGAVPAGPIGCSITVLSRNPNLGNAPAPHSGSSISVQVTKTLMRAAASGVGCGVFAFNFAPTSQIAVTMSDNVVGGGLLAAGGVSRTDAVFESRTLIVSHRNLFRSDATDACAARRLGWNLQGGSGTPVNLPNPGATSNTLRVISQHDRLEGFTTAVLGSGGRRFFGGPNAGPVSGNQLDLQMLGTRIDTPACGGAPFVADLRLAGAQVADASLVPGDDNTLRAVLRNVIGSGVRFNAFADVLSPSGAQSAALQGSGNRLVISGNQEAFARTNRGIAPMPSSMYFSGEIE